MQRMRQRREEKNKTQNNFHEIAATFVHELIFGNYLIILEAIYILSLFNSNTTYKDQICELHCRRIY